MSSVASAAVEWKLVTLTFETGTKADQATVFAKTDANSEAWIDDVELEYIGPAARHPHAVPGGNSIIAPAPRVPVTQKGITQLSNERMEWLLNAKFGLFLHWGLYAGMAHGEWHMERAAIPPETYRKLAYPESGKEYFSADHYDPAAWAQLAKDAGMKWLCLTARHHDGYNLFDVPHPNAFTSMQTHKRDFVAEYVQAVRAAGLGVGLYFSPLNWRYPGYFDITGKDCKPNKWNYVADPAHQENARLMKEENYVAVKQLLTAYGHIDQLYWDGGWLGHSGSDASAAPFHEPGQYLDPANPWPIGKAYQDIEPESGKALGILGMVRRYQPDAISNARYGWMGDHDEEEGAAPIIGPVRSARLCNKSFSLHRGGWGYVYNAKVMSPEEVIRMLADCSIRNMSMLVNVGPDKHGQIPQAEQNVLRQVGAWLSKAGEAVYGTRGGPWNPEDGRYGYCRKKDTLYVHILKDYSGDRFTVPPVGPLTPVKTWDVITGRELSFTQADDRTVTIDGIDRSSSPVDTIIAVRFDQDVMSHALPHR